ncbi:hypothetical protein HDV05_003207 [Chytridiales sp. JEL 0842]|nr:hypothetical protein HDV05_003207 [Chytridiales sp. JEL 0842]
MTVASAMNVVVLNLPTPNEKGSPSALETWETPRLMKRITMLFPRHLEAIYTKEYHSYLMLVGFMNFITTLRNIVLISNGAPYYIVLNNLINLTTTYILSYNCSGRALAFESTKRFRYLKSKVVELKMERVTRQKSLVNKILCVMLPESVIPRLEASEFQFSKVTDRIESAVCIFVDFFYGQDIMKKLRPEIALDIMNRAFIQYDELLKSYPEFEKLKTVSTKALLFFRLDTTDRRTFSKRLTEFLRDTYLIMSDDYAEDYGDDAFPRSVKVGVAQGPVVAGIVGREKFCYDVYGDCCNVASRMQTLNKGSVLISDSTYDILSDETKLEYIDLGFHSVKGRGVMRIYSLRLPQSINGAQVDINSKQNEIIPPSQAPSRRISNQLESQNTIVINLLRPTSEMKMDRIIEGTTSLEKESRTAVAQTGLATPVKVPSLGFNDNYKTHNKVPMNRLESIISSFAAQSRHGFNEHLRSHLNLYTLFFRESELENGFKVYVRFCSATKGPARQEKKLKVTASAKDDIRLPLYGAQKEKAWCCGNYSRRLEQTKLKLVKLLSEGSSGYLFSISSYTLYNALIIYLSPISDYIHVAEALIYLNIAYLGCMDCTTVSYMFSSAALFSTALPIVAFVMYTHLIHAKAAFIVQAVLDYSQKQLDKEMLMSESLLKALLPERIRTKLLLSDTVEPNLVEKFPIITILHLDVTSFTYLSSCVQPDLLINILNTVFTKFDQICAVYQIEKIQTIGDAYIAASLDPSASTITASMTFYPTLSTCLAALDIQATLVAFQASGLFNSLPTQNMKVRIGIHSGQALGALTGGQSKMKYELLGEAVENAEKVQSLGEPGGVLVSERTKTILVGVDEGEMKTGVVRVLHNGFEKFGMVRTGKSVLGQEGEEMGCWQVLQRDV